MKIVELLNRIQLAISNEESDLLGVFEEHTEIHKSDLTERQVVVANQLVNKDVLLRTNQDGRITYRKKIS